MCEYLMPNSGTRSQVSPANNRVLLPPALSRFPLCLEIERLKASIVSIADTDILCFTDAKSTNSYLSSVRAGGIW